VVGRWRRAGGQAVSRWQCYEESVKEEMNRKDRAERERRKIGGPREGKIFGG
jgi:hypothetical protein